MPARLAELAKRLEGVRAVLEGVQDLLGLPSQPMWHRQLGEAMANSLSRDLLHLELHSQQAAGKQRAVAPSPPTFLGRSAMFGLRQQLSSQSLTGEDFQDPCRLVGLLTHNLASKIARVFSAGLYGQLNPNHVGLDGIPLIAV